MPPTKPACVVHRDRVASYSPQGLLCCDECWDAYQIEYTRSLQHNDLHLRSRPFLQRLIAASANRFDEAHDKSH